MKTRTATVFLMMLSFVPLWAQGNPPGPCPPPPAVVASFLGFTSGQAAQFGNLVGQFEPTLQGLQGQIAAQQVQLNMLLSQPNPDAASLGSILLQIRTLQQQVAHATQSFQFQFASMLTAGQMQQVAAVTQAAQLQPVVGSFVALNLVAAPTPLPCQPQ